MMRFNEFPFLRYLFFFLLGVLFYPQVRFWTVPSWKLILMVYVIYTVLLMVYRVRRVSSFKILFPFFAFLMLGMAGFQFAYFKDVRNDSVHLLHLGQISGYLAEVQRWDEQKPSSFANTLKILAVQKEGRMIPANAEILLYHRSSVPLAPGDIVVVKGSPQPIPAPKNPREFDYALFMSRHQVYHSHFAGEEITVIGSADRLAFLYKIEGLRNYLIGKIDHYILDPAAAQIAKALLLGQKSGLETEVNEAYVTAGAMHVLAVSGLHVGIIYGFFFLFWKPQKLSKINRVLFLGLVVLVIWGYAALTGLSPSVLRAASMFTIMALAQMKSRSPSVYNSLALSALILIMYNPFIIYSVGFQLSYAALTGILLFQPLIVRLWTPMNRWVYYFWEITTVSIAAQLATFPISIYYFHVFPTYFLFSNLVAIPGAFLIMAVGIPFLLFSSFSGLASFVGHVVNFLILSLNNAVFSLQYLPSAKLEYLYMSFLGIVLFWAFLLFLYCFIFYKKKIYFKMAVCAFTLIGLNKLWTYLGNYRQDELYIYQVRGGVAVDYFYCGQFYSLMEEISMADFQYHILPHRIYKQKISPLPLIHNKTDYETELFLPGKAPIKLHKQLLMMNHNNCRAAVYRTGNWEEVSSVSELAINEGAVKINFK